MALSDSPVPDSLTAARERAIQSLSVHFANDALSLEELEQRIEQVYRAANVADVARLTADLAPLPAAKSPGGVSLSVRRAQPST
jgi:hypothetical protein